MPHKLISRKPVKIHYAACALVVKAEADLSDLQRRLEEVEQTCRDLKEIYTKQVVLGITHAQKNNIFDEIVPTGPAVEGEAESSGATTLVNADYNAVYGSWVPRQQWNALPDPLQASLGKDEVDTDDIMMGESETFPSSQRHPPEPRSPQA
ncbi:MAG: hypothetical protein Q9211_002107 [Gyalolechia sp. 1 TL-2023]